MERWCVSRVQRVLQVSVVWPSRRTSLLSPPSTFLLAHSNFHLVSNPRFPFPISSSSYKIPISLSNSLRELDLRDPFPICVCVTVKPSQAPTTGALSNLATIVRRILPIKRTLGSDALFEKRIRSTLSSKYNRGYP